MQLHSRIWGETGRRTVVLVHGFPDTHAVWRPVAEHLAAAGVRAVAYDVRGAGRSPAPASTAGYGLDHLVDDLAAVVDEVSPDEPVHLVGHDWGSIQGWEAVCGDRLAGRISGFTSISGPSLDHVVARRRPPSPSQAVRSWYIGAFHLPGASVLVRAAMTPDRFRKAMAAEGAQTDDEWPAPTLPDDAARGVGLYRANMLPRLLRPKPRPATVPVQLIVATRDPALLPSTVEVAERWAPDLTRVDLDAGHWVIRSRPREVASAIERVLVSERADRR
jgi:pimeloyl-ACP methyl ester carboxylesterase